MRQSIRLGSIAGIPVGINRGLLLIAAFYIFNLAVGILPFSLPDASGAAIWIGSVVAVVSLFGSILAHELGHSIVAQRNGITVNAITLWLLGGVAILDSEPDNAGAEFRIAVAGPAVSVGLGAAFGALWFIASPFIGGTVISWVLGYLAIVNVGLAVFNMIPAAPLDGGRVLAAALWWKSGNRHTARASAAKAGQVIGTGIIGVGVISVLTGVGSIVTIILGWFIRSGATQERRRAERLNQVRTADLASTMQPLVAPISHGVTLTGLEQLSASYDGPVAFPLSGSNGVVGVVSSTSVHTKRPEERDGTFIEEVAVPWGDFTSAWCGEEMSVIVERAREENKSHVVVYDVMGRQVGYVALEGILAASA